MEVVFCSGMTFCMELPICVFASTYITKHHVHDARNMCLLTHDHCRKIVTCFSFPHPHPLLYDSYFSFITITVIFVILVFFDTVGKVWGLYEETCWCLGMEWPWLMSTCADVKVWKGSQLVYMTTKLVKVTYFTNVNTSPESSCLNGGGLCIYYIYIFVTLHKKTRHKLQIAILQCPYTGEIFVLFLAKKSNEAKKHQICLR